MATRTTSTESDSLERARPRFVQALLGGGVQGNRRLTATTGLTLLILLAAEGFTVTSVRGMFAMHAFVGLLLIPPIGLKLLSTSYRFVQYYAREPNYRAAGPPTPILRMLAPVLIFLTVGLFGTGVALLLMGPAGDHLWRQLHTLFFFFWFWAMTVHVLAYVWRVPGLIRGDLSLFRTSSVGLPGAMSRESLVLGSLFLGFALAVAGMSFDAAWTQWFSHIHPEG